MDKNTSTEIKIVKAIADAMQRLDNGPVKFIKADTQGGGFFHIRWVDGSKKRHRSSTKFPVPSKDLFGDLVPPDQLRRDMARMRKEVQKHWNEIDKSQRDRYFV